jgi:transcriptional regulator with XRE-family HTH domain
MDPEDRLHRNVTNAGRPRERTEHYFTMALSAELDVEEQRRGMNQGELADFLGVDRSLMSFYRNGQKIPSILTLTKFDQAMPGFMLRVVQGYYRQLRRRKLADRSEGSEDDDHELRVPPAERVGVHRLEEVLR